MRMKHRPISMLKFSLLVFQLVLLFVFSVNASSHAIIYWDAYEEQAEQLRDISIAQGDVGVNIYPISSLFILDDGELRTVTPVEGDDPQYTEYWEDLQSLGLQTNSPYVILSAIMDDTTESLQLYNREFITLLGNPLEIPPSKIQADNNENDWSTSYTMLLTSGTRNHSALGGFPTDYYYGTRFSGGTLDDYVPDVAVSRLPVTVQDSTSQQVTINIERNYASSSIIRANPLLGENVSAGEFVGRSLYVELRLEDADRNYPYFRAIEGNTPLLSDGSFKIVATDLEAETFDIPNTADFPYIIERVQGDTEREGAYAYMSNGNIVEAFDIVSEGPRKVLVAETITAPSLLDTIDDSAEIQEPLNGLQLRLQDSGGEDSILDFESDSDWTKAILSDNINDGSTSVVMLVTSGSLAGSIYAITNFDGDFTFTIDGDASDQIPTTGLDDNPLEGARVRLLDLTDMRDYLNSLSFDNTVRYITPTIFVDEESGTSNLADTGFIFDLVSSAQGIVDKIESWSNYRDTFDAGGINADGGKVDYFQNAMLISHEIPDRWEFFSETDLIDMINFRDSNIDGAPSIFNGFNITKVFQSNDGLGSDRIALKNTIEQGVSFPSSSNPSVGTLLSNTGSVLIGQTDEFGRYELQVDGPNEDASFGLTLDVFFREDEVFIDNESTSRSSFITYGDTYLIQNSAGDPERLSFTKFDQIISNSDSTVAEVRVSMLDENEQVVTASTASVNISLFGDGQFSSADGTTLQGDFVNANLVNGEYTFYVSGNSDLTLFAEDNWPLDGLATDPNIFGGLTEISEIQDLDNLNNRMDRLRFTEVGQFGGYGDSIKISFQVVGEQGRPVAGERRVVIRVGGGKNLVAIDAMNNKGIIYANDDWVNDLFGLDQNFNSTSDFADNFNADPTIPLMISSGYDGMGLEYDFDALYEQGGYGSSATLWTNMTDGGSYTGFIGYIGLNESGFSTQFPDGTWDKGEFTTNSEENNRMLLARTTMREYSNAAEPVLGSIYQAGIEGFLEEVIASSDNSSITNITEAAAELSDFLEIWHFCGMASLKLPPHIQYQVNGDLQDEVPSPSLALTSNGVRDDLEFDRFESYTVEVPKSDDNSNTIDVSISVENHDDMIAFDSNMEYRFTIVPVAMNQPTVDISQQHARITELDYFPEITRDEIYETVVTTSNTMTYTFSENWAANSSGNITKFGPSLYMVKVESREKERSGTGITETQKAAQFTKEKRLFFRVVNEFIVEEQALFLLVNNTDQDPFRQDNGQFNEGFMSDYRVPSTAIRYYEDALDNYTYTKGGVDVSVQSDSLATFEITASEPDNMHWESRVFAGDKIRFKIPDSATAASTEFTPWLRVSSVDSDGTSLTVENNDFVVKSGNVTSSANYIVQRAYTHGYATMTYTDEIVDGVNVPTGSQTVQITIDTDIIDGFEQCVQAGDFFKFLDERVYAEIDSITLPGVVSGAQTTYTITLKEAYPTINVWTYYSNTELWGGKSKIQRGQDGTYTGSYAIYPPDPNDSSKPSYLFQTWNVHNYNTSNDLGGGLHGDIFESILEQFDNGDSDGIVHHSVIWANDAGYGMPQFTPGNFTTRNADNTGTDTQIWDGKQRHYLSPLDEIILGGFLGRGGRLMMTGQKLLRSANDESSLFAERIGALAGNASSGLSVSSITQEENDPISNVIDNEVSLSSGFAEGNKDTVEEESTLTNADPFELEIEGGRAMPVFYYGEEEDNQLAGVRASGGSNIAPYASVFYAFDFATVFSSGVPNLDFPRESSLKGRNLIMKQTIDWLRDPSLTSDDRALRIIYEAEDFDGTKSTIVLPKQSKVEVNSDLHTEAGLLTEIGVNQELAFIAQNGKLYGKTQYTWNVTAHKNGSTLVVDPNEPDNEDWHKVIFKTGSLAGENFEIFVESPDQGIVAINIETVDAELAFRLDTSDANIINDAMIYDPEAEVNFFAFGGSGLGSYTFSVQDGGVDFASDDFLTPQQRSVIYSMPDVITKLEDEVVVSIRTISGSQQAIAGITILPPVEIDDSNAKELVAGGAELTVFASGGSTTDYVPSVGEGNLVVATTVEGTNNVTVGVADGVVLSTDPGNPSLVDLTLTDPVYTSSSDNVEIKVFAAPSFEHALITESDGIYTVSANQFEEVTDGKTVFKPEDGVIPLRVVGGTGSYTVTVTGVTGPFETTGILSSDSDTFDVGESTSVTYSTESQLSINSGNASGTVTLRVVTEGGSETNVNIELVQPIDIYARGEFQNLDSTFLVKPSENVIMRAAGGTGPYTWTIEPTNIGGFGASATSAGNATTIQTSENESFYFIAADTLFSGVITVEDAVGNLGRLVVQISNIDPIEFRTDSSDLSSSFTIEEQNSSESYSFTGGTPPFTVRLISEDEDNRISLSTDYTEGSQEITITESAGTTSSIPFYRFYFFPREEESDVMITITDENELVLSSETITISKSDGPTSVGNAPGFSGSGDGGGGGGGCLLR